MTGRQHINTFVHKDGTFDRVIIREMDPSFMDGSDLVWQSPVILGMPVEYQSGRYRGFDLTVIIPDAETWPAGEHFWQGIIEEENSAKLLNAERESYGFDPRG